MTSRELLSGVAGLVLGGLLVVGVGLWIPQAAEAPEGREPRATPTRGVNEETGQPDRPVFASEPRATPTRGNVQSARIRGTGFVLHVSDGSRFETFSTGNVEIPSHSLPQDARLVSGSTTETSGKIGR